jgi:hypothetical protein
MVEESNHTPSHHSNKWYKNHPEVPRPPATTKQMPSPERLLWKRFGGPVLATGSSLVLTLVIERGYLGWIPDWALGPIWMACVLYWALAEGHLTKLYKKYPRLIVSLVAMVLIISALVLEYHQFLIGMIYRSKDARYVPPSGHKAVRFDGQIRPTPQACAGLSDEKEIACLCPRPVEYSLFALPTPTDNNYATQVEMNAGKESMYRVQLFTRTPVHAGKIEASPHKDDAGMAVVEMTFDPYTLLVQSSAPQQQFKLEVRSSEGLRLKCINQIN